MSDVPAFITGSMRSGSTLLRYLLASHDRLACPPETKFIAGLDSFLKYPQALAGIASMGIDEARLRVHLRGFVEELYAEYLRQAGKARLVDKTPGYYRLLPLIDGIFGGEAQFVIIVRHPLDCLYSLDSFCRRFAGTITDDPDLARVCAKYGSGGVAWAHYWREVYTAIEEFRLSAPGRTCVVRYEDLVSDAQAETGRVISFLGEDVAGLHVERALEKTGSKGFQDDRIRNTTAVHRYSIGSGKGWPAGRRGELWEIVREAAVVYGYSAF